MASPRYHAYVNYLPLCFNARTEIRQAPHRAGEEVVLLSAGVPSEAFLCDHELFVSVLRRPSVVLQLRSAASFRNFDAQVRAHNLDTYAKDNKAFEVECTFYCPSNLSGTQWWPIIPEQAWFYRS